MVVLLTIRGKGSHLEEAKSAYIIGYLPATFSRLMLWT